VSQATIGQWLDIDTKRTLPDWFNMHRNLCIDWRHSNPYQIGGLGHVVQIDESLVLAAKRTANGSSYGGEMGVWWHRHDHG